MDVDQDFYDWSAEYASTVWRPYLKGFREGYRPVLPALAYLGVQRATNATVVGETPDVEVVLARGYKTKDEVVRKEAADLLRAWYQAVLYRTDTFSTETPIRDFFTKMYSLGLGVLCYPVNWERWEEPPERGRTVAQRETYRLWERKRQRAFPWDVYSLHPRLLYFDTDHDPPRDFIVVDRVSIPVGKELERVDSERKPSGEQDTSERVKYVGEDWYGEWVDREPFLEAGDGADEDGLAANSLHMPWIRMAYSGLGDKNETGNFVYRCQGLIRNARSIIIAKLQSLNIKLVALHHAAYPEIKFSGQGAEALRDKWAEEGGPGAALADEGGEVQITLVPVPTIPREIFDIDRELNQMLETSLGPELLEGIGSPSETASGMRTRNMNARAPFAAPRQSGQQCIAAMLMDMSDQVRDVPQFKGGVTVQGVTLRPQDVVDHFVRVNIAPPTEEERAFKRAAVMDDLKAGIITKEDAIRETRPSEDPAAYLEKIYVENLIAGLVGGPVAQEVLEVKFRERLGLPAPVPAQPMDGNGAEPVVGASQGAAPMNVPQPEPSLGSPADVAQQVGQVVGAPLLPGGPARMV